MLDILEHALLVCSTSSDIPQIPTKLKACLAAGARASSGFGETLVPPFQQNYRFLYRTLEAGEKLLRVNSLCYCEECLRV